MDYTEEILKVFQAHNNEFKTHLEMLKLLRGSIDILGERLDLAIKRIDDLERVNDYRKYEETKTL